MVCIEQAALLSQQRWANGRLAVVVCIEQVALLSQQRWANGRLAVVVCIEQAALLSQQRWANGRPAVVVCIEQVALLSQQRWYNGRPAVVVCIEQAACLAPSVHSQLAFVQHARSAVSSYHAAAIRALMNLLIVSTFGNAKLQLCPRCQLMTSYL